MSQAATLPLPLHEPTTLLSPVDPSVNLSYRETRRARFAVKRARLDNSHTVPSTSPSSLPQPASACDSTSPSVPSSCCAHYLARKQRYCDRPPLPEQRFCGHHSEQGRTRCEHCGSLVHDDELAKHVRMCPAAARAEVEESWPFRVVDINTTQPQHIASLFPVQPAPAPPATDDGTVSSAVLRADLLVERIRQSLQACPALQPTSFTDTVKPARLPISHSTPADLSSHRIPASSLASPTPPQSPHSPSPSPSPTLSSDSSPRLSKFSKQRHQQQGDALVHTMLTAHLLHRPHTTVIEMGAGKAGLSHRLLSSGGLAVGSVEAVVLVDRDTCKDKMDGRMRKVVGVEKCSVERYRLDIKDLHIASLPSLSSPSASAAAHAVLIGKHLCGSALDLCINAVLHSFRSSPSSSASSSLPLVSGLCIASCCHHRCTFDTYCNPAYLHTHHITPHHFTLLTRLSSWACNDNGRHTPHGYRAGPHQPSAEEEGAAEGGAAVEWGGLVGIGVEERVVIGRAIKQWLDWGRVELLRAVGFDAWLTLFAPLHVTRENVALVAKFTVAQ